MQPQCNAPRNTFPMSASDEQFARPTTNSGHSLPRTGCNNFFRRRKFAKPAVLGASHSLPNNFAPDLLLTAIVAKTPHLEHHTRPRSSTNKCDLCTDCLPTYNCVYCYSYFYYLLFIIIWFIMSFHLFACLFLYLIMWCIVYVYSLSCVLMLFVWYVYCYSVVHCRSYRFYVF